VILSSFERVAKEDANNSNPKERSRELKQNTKIKICGKFQDFHQQQHSSSTKMSK
jgi:hypothetical protein